MSVCKVIAGSLTEWERRVVAGWGVLSAERKEVQLEEKWEGRGQSTRKAGKVE